MKNKSVWIIIFFFVLFLFGYQYYNNNIDKFLCAKADKYYKNNNIKKAQEFYEKAFQKGLIDSKKREIYVNSIINSEVSADSQDKLLKLLENPIDDVADLDAKIYLGDLKYDIPGLENSISVIYSENS